MELTVRDWMVIVGVLLILAVALDAARRVRSDRYSRVKVKLVEPKGEEDDGAETGESLLWPRELPNGGARVVERGELLRAAAAARAAESGDAPARPQTAEPDEVELIAGMSALDDAPVESTGGDATGSAATSGEPTENLDWLDNIAADESSAGAGPPSDSKSGAGPLPGGIEPEVFMLNVVSRKPEGFRGEDILHILLACDLRFGEMSFFHRHEFEAGRGAIQFSVANMMQPGVFDIDRMTEMNTHGLVFFVTLPGPQDMMKAFDYMLETAQAVARNLEGDVLDESRSVITRQNLEHCRQKVRDLERRMLARAPHRA